MTLLTTPPTSSIWTLPPTKKARRSCRSSSRENSMPTANNSSKTPASAKYPSSLRFSAANPSPPAPINAPIAR